MDFIPPTLLKEVEEHLKQYDDLFPRKEAREYFRYYIAGLISETQRKNIWQMMRKVIEGEYQRGHHFLWCCASMEVGQPASTENVRPLPEMRYNNQQEG